MHIADGVLSATTTGNVVLIGASIGAAVGVGYGLHRMREEDVPKVAILSSAFFVISLIALPLGGSCVHLTLNGLLGLLLGWAAFPAVFVALLIQCFAFGVGGVTTLGLNTLTMALPGVACHYLFRDAIRGRGDRLRFGAGMALGALGVIGSLILYVGAMAAAGEGFVLVSSVHAAINIALIPIEAFVTAQMVVFLHRVRPALLLGECIHGEATTGPPMPESAMLSEASTAD